MSDNQTDWRRIVGKTGKSVSVTIPHTLSIEMGIRKGVVMQIKKHEGWIAMRIDPSQNPTAGEPPAAEEEPRLQKDEPPKKDNRICGFDGL